MHVVPPTSRPPPAPTPARSDYYQSKLALEWRQWMTERFTADYFHDRTFYQVQASLGDGLWERALVPGKPVPGQLGPA